MTRRICVVTGTRAEYYLLAQVMRAIQSQPLAELTVAVTGQHLSPRFGETWRQIADDGFPIDARVHILLPEDSASAVAKSIGLAVVGFADAFASIQPDIVVLLGDRFETFAAATAALVTGRPIAHLHGGESSEGVIDESFRHAISKMAHLHFPAAMPFRKRLIQLGEQPARIHVFGALGVAALRQMDFLDRPALENALQLKLSTPLFIVTHHPPGGDAASVLAETQALLCALAGFPEATVVFTQANADAHGSLIDTAIREFARDRANVRIVGTLGQRRYLSLARLADVAIGNSSSGIVEMPALGVPSVDIGERQRGRPRPRSVVHAAARAESIRRAIVETLRPEFRATLADLPLVYDGDQGTAQGIVQTLMTVPLDDALMRKVFFVP